MARRTTADRQAGRTQSINQSINHPRRGGSGQRKRVLGKWGEGGRRGGRRGGNARAAGPKRESSTRRRSFFEPLAARRATLWSPPPVLHAVRHTAALTAGNVSPLPPPAIGRPRAAARCNVRAPLPRAPRAARAEAGHGVTPRLAPAPTAAGPPGRAWRAAAGAAVIRRGRRCGRAARPLARARVGAVDRTVVDRTVLYILYGVLRPVCRRQDHGCVRGVGNGVGWGANGRGVTVPAWVGRPLPVLG